MTAMNKVLADVTKTEQVVVCAYCSERHNVNTDGFIVVFGDIHKGMDTPVISGNISDRGKLIGSIGIVYET